MSPLSWKDMQPIGGTHSPLKKLLLGQLSKTSSKHDLHRGPTNSTRGSYFPSFTKLVKTSKGTLPSFLAKHEKSKTSTKAKPCTRFNVAYHTKSYNTSSSIARKPLEKPPRWPGNINSRTDATSCRLLLLTFLAISPIPNLTPHQWNSTGSPQIGSDDPPTNDATSVLTVDPLFVPLVLRHDLVHPLHIAVSHTALIDPVPHVA